MNALGDLLDRERRLPPQPGGQGYLLGIPLRAASQVAFVPPQPPQFLPLDPLGLGMGRLAPHLARVMPSSKSWSPSGLHKAKTECYLRAGFCVANFLVIVNLLELPS